MAFHRKLFVASSDRGRLLVDVELREDGELSICGNYTRLDGMSSGGQIAESIEENARELAGEPGGKRHLGEADLSALVAIWRRWHLNHMRPGCEHQRDWDTRKAIEFRTYSIDWDDRRQLQRHAEADPMSYAVNLLAMLDRVKVRAFGWAPVAPLMVAKLEELFELVGERDLPAYRAQALRASQGLPWEWPVGKQRKVTSWGHTPAVAKPPLLVRVEHKDAGWVRQDEHPDGVLGKACDVCGYKYGHAWMHEEIPTSVVEELLRIVGDRPEPPPDDEPLKRLGFKLKAEPVDTRPDVRAGEWPEGARHYRVTLSRGQKRMTLHYTMGPALEGEPTLADVFDCLRNDAQSAQDEDNAKELGLKPSQWAKLVQQSEQFCALAGDDAAALGLPSQGRA